MSERQPAPYAPRASRLPPAHHAMVQTGDLRLHCVEITGSGPPLVMLHGIGMDWRVWQAISRRLAPFFALYLLDLRGHGQSDKPERGYSLAHYAADVEDLLDRRGLHGAILVGSSLGGMIAAVVEAPPDLVTHRVLVDPPITGGPVRDPDMLKEIRRLKHGPVATLATFLQTFNPKSGQYYLRVMAEMWRQAADGVIDEVLSHQDDYFGIDEALRTEESHTLLLQADPQLGGILSDEGVQRGLELLPHGSVIRVPGAGHAIHAFKPEDFTRIVTRFAGIGAKTGERTIGSQGGTEGLTLPSPP